MENIDSRKLTAEQQLEKRKEAFDLLHKGLKNKEVAKELGVHEGTISRWKKRGLKIDTKGRKIGENKRLNKNIEQKILQELFNRKALVKNDPIPFWSKASILELIKKKYKKEIPPSTLGDYLKSWKLNSNEVQKSKSRFIKDIGDEIYKEIIDDAKRNNANIWWVHIKTIDEKLCFIINDNKGTLILDLYNSKNIIESFKNFLFVAVNQNDKMFLFINGLNNTQCDVLVDYINQNFNKQILEFIPINLIK